MQVYAILLALVTLAVTFSSAIPKPADAHKNRAFDRKLTDQVHFDDDEEDDDHHNPEYDHEAFLGKDEARHFEQLTPEESKEGLSKIYDKIDNDKDGKVTEEELRNWIRHVQNRYIAEDTERQWKEHEVGSDGLLTWEAFNQRTYGFIDDEDKDDDENNYETMRARDKKRWSLADQDKDGKLDLEEFSHFLHPEDAPHMKDVVIDETMEDIDKDNDGKVSIDEYIRDMWPNEDREEEPDWVKTEREQFANFRDKNKDGHMDRAEVGDWIIPNDYDHSEAEARHLIRESDTDGDSVLTREEVVDKYDLFVGSQATDFGDALSRHDEF